MIDPLFDASVRPIEEIILANPRRNQRSTLAKKLATIAIVAHAAGCKGEREQAERAEAGRITHAVAALREAANDAKPPRIAALDREACTTGELCELKRACVDAYRLHVRGLEASRIAGRALDTDAGSESGQRIAELVTVSERDLARARELVQRCSDLESAIARRYGL